MGLETQYSQWIIATFEIRKSDFQKSASGVTEIHYFEQEYAKCQCSQWNIATFEIEQIRLGKCESSCSMSENLLQNYEKMVFLDLPSYARYLYQWEIA